MAIVAFIADVGIDVGSDTVSDTHEVDIPIIMNEYEMIQLYKQLYNYD